MQPSLNTDSIVEDALFGSGTEAWNNQPSRVTGTQRQGTRLTNMPAHSNDVYDVNNASQQQVTNFLSFQGERGYS